MNALLHALGPYHGVADALIAYCFDALCLGVAIVALTLLVLRTWRPLDAAARYAVWYASIIAVAVGPLVTLAVQHWSGSGAMITLAVQPWHTTTSFGVFSPAELPDRAASPIALPELLGFAIVAGWLVVVTIGALRVIAGAVVLGRLKRDALPLSPDRRSAFPLWRACADAAAARGVRLCVSERVDVPVAVGLFDAMVVIPNHVLDAFESSDVDRFVLHELAHLERRDDWTALLQRIVQTMQFFNPAVYFIAWRLDLEREIACDDRVVAATHDVRSYAVGLTRMAESTAWPHSGLATPAIFVTRRQLSLRVERLLTSRRLAAPRFAIAPALVGFVASAALVAAATPFSPSFALTDRSKQKAPQSRFFVLEDTRSTTIHAKRIVMYINGDFRQVDAHWSKAPTPAQIRRFIRSIETAKHK